MTSSRPRVLVVGDVVDDILVLPRTRVRPDTDTESDIRSTPGGSAANVAAWLGSLGASVDFVGVVGVGDLARHAAALASHGVRARLVPSAELPTSTIVIVVDGDARTMFTERGANAALRATDVSADLLRGAAVLHLTGYSLHDGLGREGFADLVGRAREAGTPVSFSPGSAGFIADFGVAEFARTTEGLDLIIANLDEGRLLTGCDDPEAVAIELGTRYGAVVLTLGGAGAAVLGSGGVVVRVPAPSVPSLDPTGAGDAFAAGFLAAWIRDRDAAAAARAGVEVAARAVGILGGRPPTPGASGPAVQRPVIAE